MDETGSNSSVFQAKPLLRWAGSKRQFLPELMRRSPCSFNTYIEPFAGSATLYYALKPRHAVLGDVNDALINFYVQLRTYPVELHRLTSSLSQDLQTYLDCRARFNTECTPLDRAALFWYLNRTCFNGLFRTNRAGQFNVPIGRKLGSFPSLDETMVAAREISRSHIICADFDETIDLADAGDFLYIDPPYHRISKRDRGEYGLGAMKDGELGRLLLSVHAASERGCQILFSYNVDIASELQGWSRHLVRGRYVIGAKAGNRKMTSEYIFCNY